MRAFLPPLPLSTSPAIASRWSARAPSSPRPSDSPSGRSPVSPVRSPAGCGAARTARAALAADRGRCRSCRRVAEALLQLNQQWRSARRSRRGARRPWTGATAPRPRGHPIEAGPRRRRRAPARARPRAPAPAGHGAESGIHHPPGAVGDLLHHVGQLPGLQDRRVYLLARRFGEYELARQRGVQAAVDTGLRSSGLHSAAADHGRQRRGQVLLCIPNRGVRAAGAVER